MTVASTIQRRVLLVAPVPPPYGGMALQARLLERLLLSDGASVRFFASNFAFPRPLEFVQGIKGLRTVVRGLMIWPALWSEMRQAEIVHLFAASWFYFFAVVYPALILGRVLRKRVVLNYHGGEAKQFFRWWGWAAAPVVHWSTVVTAPSEFLAEVIRTRFAVPVTIVPNLVELSRFPYRRREMIQPRIVVTRHLEKLYDVESAIRAFGLVQGPYPHATLAIAGGGSQGEYLRALVAQLELRNVKFLGQVDHQVLASVYDGADICLNASVADNFPGALIEASAAGLVVVSTNVGGIPFIYENGKSALLVEPGDWKGLAAAISRLLEDPSLAVELAGHAAEMVQACEWSKVRERLYAAYKMPFRKARETVCVAG